MSLPLRSRTSDRRSLRRRPRRYLPLNSLALIFAPRRIMTRPRPCSSRHCSGRCPRRTAGRASASRALPAAAAWRRGTTCFCISVWSAAHGAVIPVPLDTDGIEERAGLAADRVPARYLDTWARLQCQLPSYAPVDTWQRAIEDGGRFLDLWGTDAAAMRWTAGELFDVPRDGRPGGLVWQLKGERVGTLGEDRARLTHGRMIKRQVRT